MRIPPPDPLATILLYLSAIQMALNAALAPGTPIAKAHPNLTMEGFWSYVPLLMLAVATLIWIVRGSGNAHSGQPPTQQVPPAIAPAAQQVKLPVPEPWHAKLTGFQIYYLIYMAMFFVYMAVTTLLKHK